MTKEKRIFQPLKSKGVCLIYELLHKKGLVSFPAGSSCSAKVEALVENIENTHFGVDIYPSIEEKAVAYLYLIIKDHAFTDGNKRTACLAFETLCELNCIKPTYGDFALDSLAVFIEETEEKDNQKVIREITDLLFPDRNKVI